VIGVSRQRGLTLVELLIGTALALGLLAGLATLFAGQKISHGLQAALSGLQETGRYAMSQVAGDLRQAGYLGCRSVGSTVRLESVAEPPDGPDAFLGRLADGQLVSGIDGDTTPTGPIGSNRIQVKPATDVLSIYGPLRRVVARVAASVSPDPSVPILVQGREHDWRAASSGRNYLVVADCARAVLFCATGHRRSGETTRVEHAEAAGGCRNRDAGRLGESGLAGDAELLQMDSRTYFVGRTGRLDGDRPMFALYRFDAEGLAEELVEGVENLQVRYGLDVDGDGLAERFVDQPSATQWGQVRAVRLWMLVVSAAGVAEGAGQGWTASPDTRAHPDSDGRLWQEFSTQIALRNALPGGSD
jgi:type IV pilus assembly protein PilW